MKEPIVENQVTEAPGQTNLFNWTALLGLIAVAAGAIRNITASSFWLHLASGQAATVPRVDTLSYTAEGEKWINGTWLYDLVLNALYSGGSSTVILVHTLTLGAAFALLIPLALRFSGPAATALAIVVSTWLGAPQFNATPGIFTLIFPALFVFILTRRLPAWSYWAAIIPLQILWTNMNPSFLLGPAVCLAFGASTMLRQDEGETAAGANGLNMRACFMLGGACLLVTLMNPYGPALHTWIPSYWGNTLLASDHLGLTPFMDHFKTPPANLAFYISLGLITGGVLVFKKRLPSLITVLAILSAAMAVLNRQAYLYFALLGMPFFALSLRSISQALPLPAPVKSDKAGLTLAALLVLLTAGGFISNRYYAAHGMAARFGLGVDTDLVADAAAPILQRELFPARLMNQPIDGGSLAWNLPERKVYLDSRLDVYGEQFRELAGHLLQADNTEWKAYEEKADPQALLFNLCSPGTASVLAARLADRKTWRLAYFDGTSAILLRNLPLYNDLLSDTGMRQAGLSRLEEERKRYTRGGLTHPGLAPRLIGASFFYHALQRHEESVEINRILAGITPNMTTAWTQLGVGLYLSGNSADAAQILGKAVKNAPNQPFNWLWLSRSYLAEGQEGKSRSALKQARNLNPEMAEHYGKAWGLEGS